MYSGVFLYIATDMVDFWRATRCTEVNRILTIAPKYASHPHREADLLYLNDKIQQNTQTFLDQFRQLTCVDISAS